MTTICNALDRWLDDGRDPTALPASFAEHAAGCARCSRALAAERALLEVLAAPPPTRAPAGLVDAAMARALSAPPVVRRRRPVVLWLLLAGCIAGAVGSAVLFAIGLSASEGASVEAPDLRPAAVAAVAGEGAVRGAALAAQTGDAWVRAYEAAPPVLQALLALLLAGAMTTFARWLARQAAGRGPVRSAGRLLARGRA